MSASGPIAERHRRAVHPWRIAFLVYALAITTGTHWPKLEIAIGGARAPDKIIHMFAFGGLMFLLWRTRWLGEGWLLLITAMAWAMVDELTQGIPGLGRSMSGMDLLANWCGIVLVFAGIRAVRPVGGPLNRMRVRMTDFVIDELFLRRSTWPIAIAGGMVLGLLIGGTAVLIMWFAHPEGMKYAAFISVPVGGLGGALLLLDALWRRERERVAENQLCLFCGASCSEAEVDARGLGACPTCGKPMHIGQWQLRTELSRAAFARLAIWPFALAVGLCVTVVLVYLSGLALYMQFPKELQPLRRFDGMPMDMRLVLDMTVLGTAATVAIHRFRVGLAGLIDQQDARCRTCLHDVHATGDERGIGRCPECGTRFIRLDDEAEAALRAAYGGSARS